MNQADLDALAAELAQSFQNGNRSTVRDKIVDHPRIEAAYLALAVAAHLMGGVDEIHELRGLKSCLAVGLAS